MTDKKTDTRGRKRIDSDLKKQRISITVSPFIAVLLDNLENKSKYVESAIKEKMAREGEKNGGKT